MQRNECEGCTMCCKVYRIAELEKPRGKWCDHCETDVGCKQYADRPKTCSTFECVWLQGRLRDDPAWSPDALRPDRCRVVVAASGDGNDFVATPDPGTPAAWRKADVLVWLHRLAAASRLAGGTGMVGVDTEPYAYVVTAGGAVMRAKAKSPVQADGSRQITGLVREGVV